MGIGSVLSHRCTIERPTYTIDAYGHRSATWSVVASAVPCRMIQETVTAPEGVFAERPVLTQTAVLVHPQTVIQQDDRLSSVTYEDGAVDGGVYVVKSLVTRRRGRHGVAHHRADVERVGTDVPSPPVPVGIVNGMRLGLLSTPPTYTGR